MVFHRNPKYLNWLRTQTCIACNKQAEVAHHVRIETGGGTGIKPSDYYCVPLLEEFHTSGPNAIHRIGEYTFFEHFNLNHFEVIKTQLYKYLTEVLEVQFTTHELSPKEIIIQIISEIESRRKRNKPQKNSKKKKISATDSEYYQKSKQLKNENDKKLRKLLKKDSPVTDKVSITQSEHYQKAKELKRIRDKELREKIKESKRPSMKVKASETEFYKKAKELKRIRDKELRDKIKKNKH